jgi:hypothetical protein
MIRPGTPIGPMGRLVESEDQYRSNPAITNSSINLFLGSERLYHDAFITGAYKRNDTASLIFGRAFHCYVLEPKEFSLRYVVWYGKRRQGKEWDQFKEDNATRTILDRDDYDTITRMSSAIEENDLAAGLISECEHEVVFRHMCGGNLARQCRVDGVSHFGPIIDLKSCEGLGEFKANFRRYGYHRQAQWYRDLVSAVDGESHEFSFIAVEKKPPYAVGIFKMDDEYARIAEQELADAMDRLERCLTSNEWKRDEPEVQVLTPWKREVA